MKQGNERFRTGKMTAHDYLAQKRGILAKIKPAIEATIYGGARTSKNREFVDEVVKTNVVKTIDGIRHDSFVLADLERAGKLKMVGAVYHLVGGKVEFLS